MQSQPVNLAADPILGRERTIWWPSLSPTGMSEKIDAVICSDLLQCKCSHDKLFSVSSKDMQLWLFSGVRLTVQSKPNKLKAEYNMEGDIDTSHFPSSAGKNIWGKNREREPPTTAYGYEFYEHFFSQCQPARHFSLYGTTQCRNTREK